MILNVECRVRSDEFLVSPFSHPVGFVSPVAGKFTVRIAERALHSPMAPIARTLFDMGAGKNSFARGKKVLASGKIFLAGKIFPLDRGKKKLDCVLDALHEDTARFTEAGALISLSKTGGGLRDSLKTHPGA